MHTNKFNKKVETSYHDYLNRKKYPKGISIILPIHDGQEYIEKCLNSLMNQTINDADYELIIIFNGIFTDSLNWLHDKYDVYEKLNITILINDQKGAGAARNLGIEHSNFSHITFVDVDDYVSPNYVQALYNFLEEDTLTLTQIHDDIDGEINTKNTINKEVISSLKKGVINYISLSRILTITVCKAIPRYYFDSIRFYPHLKSGEDTVLFSELLIAHQPKINVIPLEEHAIYYRVIREMSVSRQSISYEFLINQRLDILKILDPLIDHVSSETLKDILIQKQNAQFYFMNKYLRENPEEHNIIVNALLEAQLKHLNFRILNRGLANTLFISYCFAPSNDTSAIIVSKKIIKEQKVIDIVSNDMKNLRSKDYNVLNAVSPYIGNNIVLNHYPSFSNFDAIKKFTKDTVEIYEQGKNRYKNMYSRVMFPASHLPAALIKSRNPDVYWTAEFSDPLLKNIESNTRYSEINDNEFINYFKSGILNDFTEYVDDNLFNIVELVAFALADKIIFTNENQREYMINRFPLHLREDIIFRSEISTHPTLPGSYYELVKSDYLLNTKYVNIAYFGNFYSKRGLDTIISIKEKLESLNHFEYVFHIFTNLKYISDEDRIVLNENKIVANNFISFFEFLNLSTKFDALIVTDSKTKGIKPINPYLPSKISDYLGSGTDIIALVESGSSMDAMTVDNIHKVTYPTLNLRNFVEKMKITKSEYIQFTDEGSKLVTKNFLLESNQYITLDEEMGRTMLIPNNLPITIDKDFTFKITNLSKETLDFYINSMYKKKKIIRLYATDTNDQDIGSIDYYNLQKGKLYRIPSKSHIQFKIRYSKNYSNPGFLRAGRLYIKELGEEHN